MIYVNMNINGPMFSKKKKKKKKKKNNGHGNENLIKEKSCNLK